MGDINPPKRVIFSPATSDDDARELFEGRQPGGNLLEAVGPERAHSFRRRRFLELVVRGAAAGEPRDGLGHRQVLEDTDATLVSGGVAARAADLVLQL